MSNKILVVEDDTVFRNYLFQALKHDFEVILAASPTEACALLMESAIDIVITEHKISGIGELDLTEWIYNQVDPSLPIILITTSKNEWQESSLIPPHIFSSLRKGAFLPSELRQTCMQALQTRHTHNEIHEERAQRTITRDLAQANLDIRRLRENLRGVIFWIDARGLCTYVNEQLENILGYHPDEFTGSRIAWERLLHTEDLPVIDEIRKAMDDKKPFFKGEARAYNRSGYMVFLFLEVTLRYGSEKKFLSMDIVAADITLQKIAEDELRKATYRIEELSKASPPELTDAAGRYRQIVEGSADVIFSIDSGQRIVYMNHTGLTALGMSPEEIRGAPWSMIAADDVSNARFTEAIQSIEKHGLSENFSLPVETTQGQRIWNITLSSITSTSQKEYSAVACDITEETSINKRLRLLANIEHYSPDAIIGLDTNRAIISWNRGASMMLGWSEDEILGKQATAIIPENKQREAEAVIDAVMEKGFIKDWETRRMTKDGQILDVNLTMTVLKDDRGAIIGFSALVKDISEQKKMETALIQSERLAATGKLAASIAHEINNPLFGIRSCLNHVLNTEDKQLIDTQFVRLAVKEADRIADLIRNMKTFYLPTEGLFQDQVDMSELLKEVFSFNRKYLEENRVRLNLQETSLPPIQGVPEQLKQVFINLLTNATEAMPHGGDLTVTTELAPDGKNVQINFTDTGVGIAGEDLPRIFEMFYSKKPLVKGVGLGLSVSYGIIKRHSGKITVESQEGHGTTFKVTLPINAEWGRQLQLDLR